MYNYNGKQFKTAQNLQDEIFRNMSADKKMQLVAGFWLLAKELNPNFLERAYSFKADKKYGDDRPKKTFNTNGKNTG